MGNFIITISRQYGSGGRLIGEKLAKILNVNFYDKELIDIVVDKTGLARGVIELKDECFINDNIFFTAYNKGKFESPFAKDKNHSTLDRIFEIQSKVIRDIAKKESAIIIGRCASFILKYSDNSFNVFIHSSIENRIKRINEEYGVNIENAERELKNMDSYRYNYHKYYTGEEWGNMINYNMTLDSGCFNYDEICDIIIYGMNKKLKNIKK